MILEVESLREKQRNHNSICEQKPANESKSMSKRDNNDSGAFKSVSAFQAETPKTKINVGGYFGSLFNWIVCFTLKIIYSNLSNK